jgi:hypothetical protein
MKTKLALLSLVLAVTRLAADTVTTDTAVFVQADAKSPVIGRLKSGETVTFAGEAPAGWRRVEISGPFEAYVSSKDITKALDVRDGANILITPSKTSPVLTVAQKGDKSDVTGLAGTHGEFCQIKLEKKLQGFIATGLTANTPAPGATAQQSAAVAQPAPDPTAPGHPVAITGNTADLPRVFSGTLVLARRVIFNPYPPYDYQLTDSGGRRFAYVDTKRLVLNEKIDAYLGLVINVTGTIRNTVDGKDLVVEAESLQRN